MAKRRQSVAVILSAGGATLDLRALSDVPVGRVIRAEFAHGERAACATATFEHDCEPVELLRALMPWAHGRGWSVTVAPLQRPG